MQIPEFNEMLSKRRSIRKYTSEPLSPEQVELILKAALLAPSSMNSRPCQFIVIENKNTLLQLAQCKPAGTLPLENCVMAVCVAADPTCSDVWIEDASIAATYMQLQAEALSLGSCWVQLRGRTAVDGYPAEDFVRDMLDIPDSLIPLCIVTFGHPDEDVQPHSPEDLAWEKVHIAKFSSFDE